MSRVPTARPAEEHHAALSRMYRQISVDTEMDVMRRSALRQHLQAALRVLEEDLGERQNDHAPPPKRKAPKRKRKTT